MDREIKVKQITKLYESCNSCGLPKPNCICNSVCKIKTESKIWILSSENELIRSSNTARILKLINPESTEIFLWKRTEKPENLINMINSNIYDVYLLFPTDEESKHREVEFKKSGKIPAFIIIDGTWKEAKKIVRKSEYLKNLSMLSLKPEFKSNFILRRNIAEGTLCTIEAAIEIVKLNGEINKGETIKEGFKLFQESYNCGKSGHTMD